jgi:hypothetical protein
MFKPKGMSNSFVAPKTMKPTIPMSPNQGNSRQQRLETMSSKVLKESDVTEEDINYRQNVTLTPK